MADDIPSRVAVLEQIARNTEATLKEIRDELREFRGEMRADLRDIRNDMRTDFRFLVRLHFAQFAALVAMTAALLGVMAHGFHWI